MNNTILRIAFTPGEPAGIGPDLAIALAQQSHQHEIVAFADPELLQLRAEQLGLPLTLRQVDWNTPAQACTAGELVYQPIKLATPSIAGLLNNQNGGYVLDTLDAAIDACRENRCAALVTGPVQKSAINDYLEESNKPKAENTYFSGHTEYLAANTNTEKVVMMLATEGLRVALATTHLPLRDVADAITETELSQVIRILQTSLQQQFAIRAPRILVCGLNPHAGEGGHMGREEIDISSPHWTSCALKV